MIAREVSAQGSYRGLPLGGRSALLGNTGVALARDNAAAFLNPATLAAPDAAALAVSVNFFRLTVTRASQWGQPGAVDTARFPGLETERAALSRTDFSPLPSSLCLAVAVGPVGTAPGQPRLAFCYGATDQTSFDTTAEARVSTAGPWTDDRVQTLRTSFSRQHVGPSFALQLSPKVRLGASLHLVLTSLDQIYGLTSTIYDATGRGALTSLHLFRGGQAFGAGLLVGATWEAARGVTLGLSIAPPTLPLWGSYSGSSDVQLTTTDGARAVFVRESGSYRADLPFRVALGAGFRSSRTRVEADVFFAAGVDAFGRQEGTSRTTRLTGGAFVPEEESRLDRKVSALPVVNAAFGVERFVAKGFSVIGGGYTDFAPLDLGRTPPTPDLVAFSRRSRVALTLGVGSYGEGGELLAGVDAAYTWGLTAAPNPYGEEARLDWARTSGLQFVFILSGSTNLSTLKRAAEQVESLVGAKP